MGDVLPSAGSRCGKREVDMKSDKKAARPAADDGVETYGSPLQRFESTFQPRKKPPAPPRAREKAKSRVKKPRKPPG
jgi:hypothetical protein